MAVGVGGGGLRWGGWWWGVVGRVGGVVVGMVWAVAVRMMVVVVVLAMATATVIVMVMVVVMVVVMMVRVLGGWVAGGARTHQQVTNNKNLMVPTHL